MKRVFYQLMVPCLALLFLTRVDGIAQNNDDQGGERRLGSNAASELLIPVGARYLAMGGAAVASVKGVEAIYWNPAGLAHATYRADAMFSFTSYIADINVNYFALGTNFEDIGSIGFSVKLLDLGDIPETTELAPDGTGAIIQPQFTTVGLTYSRILTDRISVGATASIVKETIERVDATGVAFDFGVQYSGLANIEGLSLGVVVKSVGPSMEFGGSGLLVNAIAGTADRADSPYQIVAQKDELPSSLELGLSYMIPKNIFGDGKLAEMSSLEFVGTFQDANFTDDIVRIGGEYSYNDMFFFRGGYNFAPDAANDPGSGNNSYIYNFVVGGGVHYDFQSIGITVDYAYRNVDFFDSNNVLSIRLGF